MKNKVLLIAFLCVVSVSKLFGGAAQEGASTTRGTFLSRGGYIIHPDEIQIDQYIARQDYNYPLPEQGDLNVITASGINADSTFF